MSSQTEQPRQRHILVVDDDVDLAIMYKESLEERGYRVTTAPNGVLALKCILQREVDAIVCDLKMPEMQGDKFFQTIERLKPHLCKRFIFVTGVAGDPQFQAFVEQMASQTILKPAPIEKIFEALEKVLSEL